VPVILDKQAQLRPFRVRLPSGDRYWTLLDEVDLTPVAEVDEFLRHVRFGRDQAESTTATHASALKLYLLWCARTGQDCYEAAGRNLPAELRGEASGLRYYAKARHRAA
jgi:integrase/recombinase XerD